MKFMKNLFLIFIVLVSFSCTNLQEVRDFSKESSNLSGYVEVTNNFLETYNREKLYLSGTPLQLAEKNNEKRKDIYPDLIDLKNVVTSYMKGLGELASDENFNFSDEVNTLGNNISGSNFVNLSDTEAQAARNLVSSITKWPAELTRQKYLNKYIEENNNDFQIIIKAMEKIVRTSYKSTNNNEFQDIKDIYDAEKLKPQDDMALKLVIDKHYIAELNKYQSRDKQIDLVAEKLKKIGDGHQSLYENRNSLSEDEIRKTIKVTTQELKGIEKNYKILAE